MRALLLTIFLLSSSAFASGLHHLNVQKLNFDYTAPAGQGTVEKLDIGLSKAMDEAVAVERVGETFVARTTFLDFTWMEPWKFLFDVEALKLENLNLKASKLSHEFSLDHGSVKFKGEYKIEKMTAKCEGSSDLPDLENRLFEDCRESMIVEMDRLDIPMDFFLVDILNRLPPMPEDEAPLKNFTLTSKQGDFYMYFLAKYVLKAGLRTWGAFHYEEDFKTLVIRVDLVKFGYIPVTSTVLRELKNRIKDPRVQVDPPLIRIRMRE